MNRIKFLVIAILIGCFSSMQSYAYEFNSNSVLASGTWVKIRVKESGICKLTFEQLAQMGFTNPSEIRVFGYGGSMLSEDFSSPKIDDLNEVPLYEGYNYFLFYAQGPIKWGYNNNRKKTCYDFTINPYSVFGYYFVTDNVGTKKRISTKKEAALTEGEKNIVDINNYMDIRYRKVEEFNLISSGKQWYGDKILSGNTSTFRLDFPDVDTTETTTIYLNCTGSSNSSSTINTTTRIGDSVLYNSISIPLCSQHVIANEGQLMQTCKPSNGQISISLTYHGSNNAHFATVERIIATTYRKLSMNGASTLFFRNPKAIYSDDEYIFHVDGCTSNHQIWNLKDPQSPVLEKTELKGSVLTFSCTPQDNTPTEYVAVNVLNPDYITAEYVGTVANQNLHASVPADMVIITHPDFIEGAQQIAALHFQYDNMDTHIIIPEQIYNEFSSGTPDPTAIRWYMKKLYEANGHQPFYLLLIGDGCYDNRGVLTALNGTKLNNYIITYQGGSSTDAASSYTSDDYFCFLEDNEISKGKVGNATMDISVGRIPCQNMSQLNGVINKIKTHMENNNFGKWKNKIVLLADDNEESNSYQKFCEYSDNVAKKVQTYNPDMDVKKIYLDAYTRTTGSNGSRYYDVERIIEEEIENGVMFFNYVGHSSKIGFSAEHVFTQNKAGSIYNKNCGFWFTASCEFSQYDDLDHSGGEDLLLNPNGGALTLISSSRVVFDNKNDNLNQALFTHLFERDMDSMPLRIGDVVRLSKCQLKNDSNKLAFHLLGDPALRLNYPANHVLTDSIVEIGGQQRDTLNALSEIQVFGHITDKNYNKMNDFNGTLFITLYDKEVTLYTKANIYTEKEDIIKNRHEYKDRPNVLFSGQVDVTDGNYTFCFKLPKDINYNYGTGRLAYYAYDEENKYEAQGSYEDFIIGGSSEVMDDDTDGPILQLFMNTESFVSGSTVNSSPVFFAKLYDENGINASGVGIGHDITLTISGSNTPIILNNYFSYSKGSYNNGMICYQLNDLPDGEYTLTLKIWDLLNNSSTSSINFVVDHNYEIEITELIAYPNPAKDHICLQLINNEPLTVQSFRFLLYDIYGKIVYESEEIQAKTDGTLTWTWDLCNTNGNRVAPGCYIGRAEVKTDDKKYKGKSKKIIILPQ